MPTAIAHKQFNLALKAFKRIGLRCTEHPGTMTPRESRFEGCWLEPDGVHFVRKRCTIGHLVHEAAHYALIAPDDRDRLRPGHLGDLEIQTCGEDPACEAWSAAFAKLAGFSTEFLFTDIEDYNYAVSEAVDEYHLSMKIAIDILQGNHVGVRLLQYLGLCDEFPKMKQWFADEVTVARHQRMHSMVGGLDEIR